LLDNKRAEYRKLLTTITEAGSKLIIHYGMEPIVATGKQERAIDEMARKSVTVIYNRLFIAADMERLNLQRRWENAISAPRNTHDVNAFGKAMDQMMDDIRRAAVRDFN
jgi:hypothetical protein